MPAALLTRRRGLQFAAATAAGLALPLREALAQAAANDDWLAMVRQHHGLIERAFDELIDLNERDYERVDLQVRTLEHLVNAHSLAEETVLYPALARAGMEAAARELYLDEAHVDILKARLTLATRVRDRNADWRGTARQLRQDLLAHAKQDEEQRHFPQLARSLDARQNKLLAQLYAAHFASVMPVRPRR